MRCPFCFNEEAWNFHAGNPFDAAVQDQIVGTQAVLNVLTGSRWSIVSKEMKDYLCGYYGKAPGPIDPDVFKKVVQVKNQY